MLNRQKILIELVRLAGGRIDPLVLTQWAFLVRKESASLGGNSFYDFVPYQHGPFSFTLFREAEKLVSQGYLLEAEGAKWKLGDVRAPEVDKTLQTELASVSARFKNASRFHLSQYVYTTYPRFTVNCKNTRNAERPVAKPAVYTAGYEGKSVEAFLDGLTQSGITRLIDVRRNPVARRFGFHRTTLNRLCEQLGIRYNHVPELGIPSESRRHLDTLSDYTSLFQQYESTTLKSEQLTIKMISAWIAESPSVLVCMEANPNCCHRARLANPVSRTTCLPIVHLN